jgi:hypothetical protein
VRLACDETRPNAGTSGRSRSLSALVNAYARSFGPCFQAGCASSILVTRSTHVDACHRRFHLPATSRSVTRIHPVAVTCPLRHPLAVARRYAVRSRTAPSQNWFSHSDTFPDAGTTRSSSIASSEPGSRTTPTGITAYRLRAGHLWASKAVRATDHPDQHATLCE